MFSQRPLSVSLSVLSTLQYCDILILGECLEEDSIINQFRTDSIGFKGTPQDLYTFLDTEACPSRRQCQSDVGPAVPDTFRLAVVQNVDGVSVEDRIDRAGEVGKRGTR